MVAFLPDLMIVGSLDQSGDDGLQWVSPLPAADGRRYRLCENYREAQVCNWAVAAEEAEGRCWSCRMTLAVPDIAVSGQHSAWYRLEVAKRRLLYTLLTLGLPMDGGPDHEPLGFKFLADADPAGAPVLTGHSNGVITINIAEADDAERERRRLALGEPYRTLLGHMRHEVGHYYWARLMSGDASRLSVFRELFGDERQDYADSLRQHYESGPPPDWYDRFVSSYASAHAWEDWAETWAHYLHVVDTIETAAACGVSLRPPRPNEPSLPRISPHLGTAEGSFERLLDAWFPITYLLNNLSRGLGHADAYPFVLSDAVIQKLRFVHETVVIAAQLRCGAAPSARNASTDRP